MEKPINPASWTLGFLGIIAIRMFIEFFIASKAISTAELIIEYLHNFFFFILAYLIIWLILSLFLKENPSRLSAILLWASWLIILPPLIDIIKTGGQVYWSFYALNGIRDLWGQFLTFFGHLPTGIVYFGTRIVFISTIVLSAFLVLIKAKSWFKAVLTGLAVYGVLFFMGSFPSFFSFAYYYFEGSKKILEVSEISIVEFLGTPARLFGTEFENLSYALAYKLDLIYYPLLLILAALLFFSISQNRFWAVIKNLRFPQLIYHTGLFLTGLGIGVLAYPQNFNINLFSILAVMVLMNAICLAWKASVVVNDIYDFEIDEISNPERPLQKKVFTVSEYANLGIAVFILSLIGGLTIGLKFAALLLIYQFIAWTYSAPPFRLKKFPIVATFISAAASLVIFFMGFTLVSGDLNIHGLSWRIVLLLLASLTLSLPIKDLKDIEGDKKYGIWTIPVIFGSEKGRLIVAINVFISFMLSVFLLNEFRLFWWVILFGGVSFLAVTNEKINPRNLFWWVLGSVGAYWLILIKAVFI